jgi:hypothetical protein
MWTILVQIALQLIHIFVKNDKHKEALLKQLNDFIKARDQRHIARLEQNKKWTDTVKAALDEIEGKK